MLINIKLLYKVITRNAHLMIIQ